MAGNRRPRRVEQLEALGRQGRARHPDDPRSGWRQERQHDGHRRLADQYHAAGRQVRHGETEHAFLEWHMVIGRRHGVDQQTGQHGGARDLGAEPPPCRQQRRQRGGDGNRRKRFQHDGIAHHGKRGFPKREAHREERQQRAHPPPLGNGAAADRQDRGGDHGQGKPCIANAEARHAGMAGQHPERQQQRLRGGLRQRRQIAGVLRRIPSGPEQGVHHREHRIAEVPIPLPPGWSGDHGQTARHTRPGPEQRHSPPTPARLHDQYCGQGSRREHQGRQLASDRHAPQRPRDRPAPHGTVPARAKGGHQPP